MELHIYVCWQTLKSPFRFGKLSGGLIALTERPHLSPVLLTSDFHFDSQAGPDE